MRQILLILLIFTVACKTADKALSDRNYDKAYKLSMKALKKEKSVKENKSILEKSLAQIIKREQVEISERSNSEDLKNWDKALKVNLDLQEKIEKASNYLGNVYGNEYNQLQSDYTELRDELGDVYFTLGLEDLEKAIPANDKLMAQDAYHHFVKSEKYGKQSEALDSLKAESLDAGLLIYLVDADGSFDYSWEINRKFDDIETYSNSFRELIYDRQVSGVDCAIDISFGRIDVSYDEDSSSRNFQESVLVGTETQVDTAGNETEVNIYETVEGTVYTVEQTKFVRWDLSLDVRAQTGNCVLRSDNFSETVTSTIEEYRLDGDERAIPDRYKRARSGLDDDFDDTDDMAEELIDRLYREVVGALF